MRFLPYNHPKVRAFVWDITDGRCAYCGVQMNPFRNFTIDHITPQCMGGTDALTNLLPCCVSCNSAKGGMHPIDWVQSRRTWIGTEEFHEKYADRLRAMTDEWVTKTYGSWDNWRAGIEVR